MRIRCLRKRPMLVVPRGGAARDEIVSILNNIHVLDSKHKQ